MINVKKVLLQWKENVIRMGPKFRRSIMKLVGFQTVKVLFLTINLTLVRTFEEYKAAEN